ncbi:CvpA family protein [Clostridium aminobutyricum]|uniref:CvpA family protein n=1 Tax=Clostridium aminobutyricum TaxID=33953 RepID=A0A939IGX8_CLOAM|nr:CvpA family protein [Clostridium aminobutyricum]MBN7774130.1 CvpA family protein [Clostridium aminobutyricum]
MVLDIIVAVIMLTTMVQGYRRGFLQTFLPTVGWFVGLAAAFFCAPKLKSLMVENTTLYQSVHNAVLEKVSSTLSPQEMQGTLPTIIQDFVSKLTETLSGSIAAGVSDFLFTILSFLLLAIGIKWIIFIIFSLPSKRKGGKGLPGLFNGLMGLLFGLVKGLLIVFIFLALVLPVASLAEPKYMSFLLNNLDQSKVAIELYNNNLILLIIRDFMY